jgi:hypothetical protein
MKATRAGRLVLLLLVAGGLAARARADGLVVGVRGAYVGEQEQNALIEWHGGRERLFVATRTGSGRGPSVWVVPVPGQPDEVVAEPVARFPRVVSFRSVTAAARARLGEVRDWGLLLDSGFLVVFALLGQRAGVSFDLPGPRTPEGVQVHERVEKLGLVVELVTAQSPKTLDHYLAGHALGVRATDLTPLEGYFDRPYTFVCAWAAGGSAGLTARAIRIDFPSPTVYYPLRPSQVYGSDLATTLYVRGWVRPSAGSDVRRVRCHYGDGFVREEAVEQGPGDRPAPSVSAREEREPLTRIDLTTAAPDWSEDLHLEPGAPAAVRVAEGINTLGPWRLFVFTAAAGVVVALFLPWLVMPPRQRSWEDWVWAVLVGAATCLSILAAAMVYYAWCCDRKPAGQQLPLGQFARLVLWIGGVSLALLALAVGLREVVGVSSLDAVLRPTALLALLVFAVALPVAVVCLVYAAAREQVIWLVMFAVVHLGLIVGLTEALSAWLAGPF